MLENYTQGSGFALFYKQGELGGRYTGKRRNGESVCGWNGESVGGWNGGIRACPPINYAKASLIKKLFFSVGGVNRARTELLIQFKIPLRPLRLCVLFFFKKNLTSLTNLSGIS